MKSISALLVFFSLLLVATDISYARKDLGDYWKNTMDGQPMPEAIKNLIQVPQASSSLDAGKDGPFIKDFDVKTNVILYHTHTHVPKNQEKQEAFDQNCEPAISRKQEVMVEQTTTKRG